MLDAQNRIVRHLAGTRDVDDEEKAVVSDVAGYNRVTWDLTKDPPIPWFRAPKWNRGPQNGADLTAGAYRVRLNVDGRSFVEPLTIAADTRARRSRTEEAAHTAFVGSLYDDLSRLD